MKAIQNTRRCVAGRRGLTLIEIVIATMVLGVVTVIFGTVMPMATLTATVASEDTYATTVAREKMEQVKSLSFEGLNYEGLCLRGVIDSYPDSAPYSFTSTENLGAVLRDGAGEIEIEDVDDGIRQVRISILWTDARANPRTVTLVSQATDQ